MAAIIAFIDALQHLDYAHKLAIVTAATLVQAAGLLAARRLPPAAALATAVLPAVCCNVALPFVFHRDNDPVSLAFGAFLLTWLASFKALALACGRGPLVQQPWSVVQAWVLLVAPIVPASAGSKRRDSPGPPLLLFARWLAEGALTAAVVFGLQVPGIPALARTCLYLLGLFSMLGVAMDGPAALLLRPLRLDLQPHFRAPWLSPSIAAFWGVHWNQAASNSLRTTLYDPIVEQSLLSRPLPSRRAAAAAAAASLAGQRGLERRRLLGMSLCFLASGVMHEVIMWYVTGKLGTPHLAWLWFFTGQAPLIVGERWLLAALQRRRLVPRLLVRQALTLSVLTITSHWLFFGPAERMGVPALFAASMRDSFAALAAAAASLVCTA